MDYYLQQHVAGLSVTGGGNREPDTSEGSTLQTGQTGPTGAKPTQGTYPLHGRSDTEIIFFGFAGNTQGHVSETITSPI